MPFKKGDPNTKAAASKGGKTGVKHFTAMSRTERKRFNSEMGKRSGEARRKRLARMEAGARRYEHKVMHDYIDDDDVLRGRRVHGVIQKKSKMERHAEA